MGDLKVIRKARFRSSNSTFVGKYSQQPPPHITSYFNPEVEYAPEIM
jgi:hypothetical protein